MEWCAIAVAPSVRNETSTARKCERKVKCANADMTICVFQHASLRLDMCMPLETHQCMETRIHNIVRLVRHAGHIALTSVYCVLIDDRGGVVHPFTIAIESVLAFAHYQSLAWR
jgi:hypothetical protein